MSERISPTGQRQHRLGMLTLVADPAVPRGRFERWLPRTGDSGGQPAEVELWLGGTDNRRDTPSGSTRLVPGGVAVWIDEPSGKAALRSPAGHAELDLGERWGRITPRDGTSELHGLLNACCAILMGRAGAVLVDASTIIDATGGGWMIVGPRDDRSALVRSFAAEGCEYVSDDQVIVRNARNQPGVLVLESWHRPRGELPPEKWKPVAPLRGVLLARAIVTKTPLPWRAAAREQALASVLDSSPHLVSDPGTEELLRELLAACATRPAITALMSRDRPTPPGGAARQLAAAVDSLL